jgi:ABC-type Fe3+ transport system permease subunit
MMFKFPPRTRQQQQQQTAMAEGGAGSTGSTPYRSLQDTPTWALATVCFIFIFTGIFIEYLIHLLSHVSQALENHVISSSRTSLTINCTVAVAEKK